MDDGQENCFLAFEEGGCLEAIMISNVFLLLISWEEKPKFLLGPKIYFELGDKLEGIWLEPVFKVWNDLVVGLNAGGMPSSRWLRNLEEEECEDLDRFPNVVLVDSNLDEIRCMKLESWKECFKVASCSLFIIEKHVQWIKP